MGGEKPVTGTRRNTSNGFLGIWDGLEPLFEVQRDLGPSQGGGILPPTRVLKAMDLVMG